MTPRIHHSADGSYPAWAWPGGYPIFYITADGGILCPPCANAHHHLDDEHDSQWHVVGQDINWEDAHLYCDHCNAQIESAYGEDNEVDNV